MKRSTQIGLAAVGVIMVASLWPRSEPESGELVYNNLDECRRHGRLSASECEAAFAQASAARLSQAPKFNSQRECEAQYGGTGCSSARIGGAEYFIPALAGFMLARGVAGGAQPLLPPTASACPPGSTNPECQQARSGSSSSGSGGGYSSGGRRAYSTVTGRNFGSVSSTSNASSSRVSTTSRGGFGSIARSFSSRASS